MFFIFLHIIIVLDAQFHRILIISNLIKKYINLYVVAMPIYLLNIIFGDYLIFLLFEITFYLALLLRSKFFTICSRKVDKSVTFLLRLIPVSLVCIINTDSAICTSYGVYSDNLIQIDISIYGDPQRFTEYTFYSIVVKKLLLAMRHILDFFTMPRY